MDQFGHETSWNIINLEQNSIVMSGDQYTQSWTQVNVAQCLAEGSYKFSIFDSRFDGMCYPTCGNYTLLVNNEIIKEGDGKFGEKESKKFQVLLPSVMPSVMPSHVPSDTPTK